jgi:hypothetical protein
MGGDRSPPHPDQGFCQPYQGRPVRDRQLAHLGRVVWSGLPRPLGRRGPPLARPRPLASVPAPLHYVDARHIPLAASLLLRLLGCFSLFLLPAQGPCGLHIADPGDRGHRSQQHEDPRRQPCHHRVPLTPAPRTLRHARPSGRDRLIIDEPLQVGRQAGGRLVTLPRVPVDGLVDDHFQIGGHPPVQPTSWRRRSGRRRCGGCTA